MVRQRRSMRVWSVFWLNFRLLLVGGRSRAPKRVRVPVPPADESKHTLYIKETWVVSTASLWQGDDPSARDTAIERVVQVVETHIFFVWQPS